MDDSLPDVPHERKHDPGDEGLLRLSGDLYLSQSGLAFLEVKEREGEFLRPKPLTNFSFRITRAITKDDGANAVQFFEVEGKRWTKDRVETKRATIPASEYQNMQWIITAFGPEYVIFAGGPTRDKVRQCGQHLSDRIGIARVRVKQHTGYEVIDGVRCYITRGGGITGDSLRTDVETDLEGILSAFNLPAPVRGRTLRDDALAELRILDLAPDEVSGPLFAAQPLALCSEFSPIDVVLMLVGPTGTGKSEAAMIAASHGGDFDRHNAISAASTANAIGLLSFRTKNALLVVDDFAPDGNAAQQDRSQGTIQSVIRQGGNVSGKSRMRRDGSLQQEFYSRGMILLTGEDLPRGHSINGRLFGIEIGPGSIRFDVLTELQEARKRRAFARVNASIISWKIRNWDAVRETYLEQVEIHERRFRQLPLAHTRHAHAMAMLTASAGIWLDGLVELDAITKDEADAAWERVSRGIEKAGLAQSEAVRAVDPCQQFLRLVGSAIGAGDAHLSDPEDNGPPNSATVLGWTMQMIRTRDGLEPDFRTRGPRIGWIDDRGIFLLPDAALNAAQQLGRSQGVSIPWASKTLGKRLAEGGHLLSTEAGRNTQKVRVAGSFQRVWHVPTASIVDIAGPSEDAQTVLPFDRRRESA